MGAPLSGADNCEDWVLRVLAMLGHPYNVLVTLGGSPCSLYQRPMPIITKLCYDGILNGPWQACCIDSTSAKAAWEAQLALHASSPCPLRRSRKVLMLSYAALVVWPCLGCHGVAAVQAYCTSAGTKLVCKSIPNSAAKWAPCSRGPASRAFLAAPC